MPSKLDEKRKGQKLIDYLNKVEGLDLIIDLEHLKNRADNENPDIRAISKRNPMNTVDIEITDASDSKHLEIRTRTWENITQSLRAITKDLHTPNTGFMFHINGSRVVRSADVRKDLAMFKRDMQKFKNRSPSEKFLNKLGYSVITKITKSEENLFLLYDRRDLSGDSYFDRIEYSVKKEKNDLLKKGFRNKITTTLLVSIDSCLGDEVKYGNINVEEVDNHCHFTNNYKGLFKEIYVLEDTGADKIFKLSELESRAYGFLN